MNPRDELTCFKCKKFICENEGQEITVQNKVWKRQAKMMKKNGGGIPIPQSDDSDEDTWLDQLQGSDSEQEEESTNLKKPVKQIRQDDKNRKFSEDLALFFGPRKDGIIRMNNGCLLTTYELTPLPELNPTVRNYAQLSDLQTKGLPANEQLPTRWTRHVLAH